MITEKWTRVRRTTISFAMIFATMWRPGPYGTEIPQIHRNCEGYMDRDSPSDAYRSSAGMDIVVGRVGASLYDLISIR